MKKINIRKTIRGCTSVMAILGLFIFSACNNGGGESKTDYVNEIEAAENAVGDPVLENVNDDAGEPQEIAPADVEANEDSAAVEGETADTTLREEESPVE